MLVKLLLIFKSIFIFKKSSYVLLSGLIALIYSIISQSSFGIQISQFLKEKLNTDDILLNIFIVIIIIFSLVIVLTFDTITGVMAAKKEKEPIVSSKGIMGVLKLIFYTIWIFIVLVFQTISIVTDKYVFVTILNYIMFFSTSLIILWEFKSIGENLNRRFGKNYAFFTMIDKLIDLLEAKVGSFLEKSLCK